MKTDPALVLSQWFATGCPNEVFSAAHGFDHIKEGGEFQSIKVLKAWLETVLTNGNGRNDAIFIVSGHEARSDVELDVLNDLCLSHSSARGRGMELIDQGATFVSTLKELGQKARGDLVYPIAVGHAAHLTGLPLDMTLRFYLQSLCANLASCAAPHLSLSAVEQQRILSALAPSIETVARSCLNLGLNIGGGEQIKTPFHPPVLETT